MKYRNNYNLVIGVLLVWLGLVLMSFQPGCSSSDDGSTVAVTMPDVPPATTGTGGDDRILSLINGAGTGGNDVAPTSDAGGIHDAATSDSGGGNDAATVDAGGGYDAATVDAGDAAVDAFVPECLIDSDCPVCGLGTACCIVGLRCGCMFTQGCI